MSEFIVNASKLRGKDSKKVDELKKFLEDKVGVNVSVRGDDVVLKFEKAEMSLMRRSFLRERLHKFLHRAHLKDDFRVISGGKNAFIIKDKKRREEEE